MINKISFGSTYRVNLKDNNNSWEKMNNFQNLQYDIFDVDKTTQSYSSFDTGTEHLTMVTDDSFDNYVEQYLKSQNIVFHKYTKKELFSEKSIRERMVVPNDNYPTPRYLPDLVEVNTENFDKAFGKSDCYITLSDKNDNPERYSNFEEYLKSAEDIDAPEVYISEENAEPVIDFLDGRHRYATMRNMGFKTIPVAMDADSLAVAQKYKLV